jgi:hypothetical protein
MPLDSATLTETSLVHWEAQVNKTGYNPIRVSEDLQTPVFSYSKAVANNAAGGADVVASNIYTIPTGAGGLTIDLQALVDVANNSGVILARIKWVRFQLLPATHAQGSACSGVTIGNAASNGQKLFGKAATDRFELLNGEQITWGTNGALGRTVSGTTKNVLVVDDDATVVGKLQVTLAGGTS